MKFVKLKLNLLYQLETHMDNLQSFT